MKQMVFIDWNLLEWTFFDSVTLKTVVGSMTEPTFSSVKEAMSPHGIGVGRTKTIIEERSVAVCEGFERA